MTAPERGFLLLTAALGDPDVKPLTRAQLRDLTLLMRAAPPLSHDHELTARDLRKLGIGEDMAERIVKLLSREELLDLKLAQAGKRGCKCLTRISQHYPQALRNRLGSEAPGTIWYKGNADLLTQPAVALVGSRELNPENEAFARELGKQAALQGFTLISGNARGADQAAQDACLANGGHVISVVADKLEDHPEQPSILWLSEDSFDLGFSPQRALSRNRIIHALPCLTFVAQCGLQTGGTWNGTVQNLAHQWSPVLVFSDGSPAAFVLQQKGAVLIPAEDLADIGTLILPERTLFDDL